jgi:hypothetical protein
MSPDPTSQHKQCQEDAKDPPSKEELDCIVEQVSGHGFLAKGWEPIGITDRAKTIA